HKLRMAWVTLSSMSLSFFILLIITFTSFMQPIPVTADLKIRKLGVQPSPPPQPTLGFGFKPPRSKPPPSG
ncbi:hypothetical protein VIGAN_11229900, partial [Vigna angularis var. angularis]